MNVPNFMPKAFSYQDLCWWIHKNTPEQIGLNQDDFTTDFDRNIHD